MSTELLDALKTIEKEKGISSEILVQAVEDAMVTAYIKNFNQGMAENKIDNVHVVFDTDTGEMKVFAKKTVREVVEDDRLEISLDVAREINKNYEIDDVVEVEVTPKNFGRVAAANAKQLIVQRIREAERGIVYDEFIDKKDDIITGIVQRRDARNIYVQIGRTEAVLPVTECLPGENFRVHERIKLYVTRVDKTNKGPQISVSRTSAGLMRRLFELEVPEIYEGIVEIKSVAREAGERSKICVWSSYPEVDPIGACVGKSGERVGRVVEELGGEKIDIIQWSENPVDLVANALSPSQVLEVLINEEEKSTIVIVPDYQLSLAIGKRGQNVRLAAKLTGWKIDIKSESEARELGILSEYDDYDEFGADAETNYDGYNADDFQYNFDTTE